MMETDEISENPEPRDSGSTDGDMGGATVIPFPHYTVPDIDWNEIEEIRVARYPDVSPEIMAILKGLMEATPNSSEYYEFEIESYSNDIYPPDPIPMIPGKASAIWVMDLLDRFGGTVSYNDLSYTIERDKIRHPVFLIRQLSEEQFSAMNDCLEEYEYMAQNAYWKIFSKYSNELKLVVLFFKDLADETRIFQGTFDTDTFHILQERIEEGRQPWDEILQID